MKNSVSPVTEASIIPLGRLVKDITGRRFGRLTTLRYLGSINRHGFWLFRCDCGIEKRLPSQHVLRGYVVSCGCYCKEVKRTHGYTGTKTYMSWIAMKSRCHNANHADYPHWGKRGIIVCERWKTSFDNFLSDMGERPAGKTLDRFPNNRGNYEPGNCRWATPKEQANNKGDYPLTTRNP